MEDPLITYAKNIDVLVEALGIHPEDQETLEAVERYLFRLQDLTSLPGNHGIDPKWTRDSGIEGIPYVYGYERHIDGQKNQEWLKANGIDPATITRRVKIVSARIYTAAGLFNKATYCIETEPLCFIEGGPVIIDPVPGADRACFFGKAIAEMKVWPESVERPA